MDRVSEIGFWDQKLMREMGWTQVEQGLSSAHHSTLKNHQKWQKFGKKIKKSLVQIAFNPKPDFWKGESDFFDSDIYRIRFIEWMNYALPYKVHIKPTLLLSKWVALYMIFMWLFLIVQSKNSEKLTFPK